MFSHEKNEKSGLASLMSRYDVPKVIPPQRLPNWFPASIEAWNGEFRGLILSGEIPKLKTEVKPIYKWEVNGGKWEYRGFPQLKMKVKPFINGKTINMGFSNATFSNGEEVSHDQTT